MTAYDVVVVGAGAAGAPLAARLSEDPARTVLLVEAGRDYPATDAYPAELLDAGLMAAAMPGHPGNWAYHANLTPDLPYAVARGKVLGGSTALNGAYFVRARRADFDRWVALGNPEWSYEKVLPCYRRLENDLTYGETELHGGAGPMPVCRRLAGPHPVTEAFYQACDELGYPPEEDKNAQGEPGYGPLPMNAVDGIRINTGIAYVNPHRDRPNLTVRGCTTARRVMVDGARATGLEVETDGRAEVIGAGEVVLCAGAIGSPHLLALSGIGPEAELTAAGVRVVVDLPGVGKGFSDHPDLSFTWRPRRRLNADGRTAFESALHVGHLEILPSVKPLAAVLGTHSVTRRDDLFFSIAVQRAESRGTVTTVSGDPGVQPRIDYHYLETDADLRAMREVVRTTVAILRSRAFKPYFHALGGLPERVLDDDATLNDWIRAHLATAIHACGSCAMGPDGDKTAVVDQYGRVHGVRGLRVADTSILPTVPSRGPAATAVMIGERVAGFMASGR
jgi:predicted dehydrogenase (TIGR03970 family)